MAKNPRPAKNVEELIDAAIVRQQLKRMGLRPVTGPVDIRRPETGGTRFEPRPSQRIPRGDS